MSGLVPILVLLVGLQFTGDGAAKPAAFLVAVVALDVAVLMLREAAHPGRTNKGN